MDEEYNAKVQEWLTDKTKLTEIMETKQTVFNHFHDKTLNLLAKLDDLLKNMKAIKLVQPDPHNFKLFPAHQLERALVNGYKMNEKLANKCTRARKNSKYK
jgi:hypothetical protein